MTTKRVAIPTIDISEEAVKALSICNPSDNRLVEVINGLAENGAANRQLQRWMAMQILGNMGYKMQARVKASGNWQGIKGTAG